MPLKKDPTPQHDYVIIRISSLGDVVLSTGVLLYWSQTWDIRFIVLTRREFVPVFEHNPAVRETIGLAPEQLRGKQQIRLFRALSREWGDLPLVDLQGSLRSGLLRALWPGPTLKYAKLDLARRIFLLSRGRIGKERLNKYNVPQRYYQALPFAGNIPDVRRIGPKIFLSQAEVNWAGQELAKCGWPAAATGQQQFPQIEIVDPPVASGQFLSGPVALHPFATHSTKTWPHETWLEMASLLEKHNMPFFWVGKNNNNFIPVVPYNFVNRTDLRQLAALLAKAEVLITGDSGPMHIASGVHTPVLALFGPTCREWGFFPAGERDVVLQAPIACRPCTLHGKTCCTRRPNCLQRITPAQVVQELRKMRLKSVD